MGLLIAAVMFFAAASPSPGSPAKAGPFTDFRGQTPGRKHLIRPADLPAPNQRESVDNGPRWVARPKTAWPQAPAGFKVEVYATDLSNPRLIRIAPNGDVFVAESEANLLRVFRGVGADGRAVETKVFAKRGLKQPFGLAFYPAGPNPRWLYVANTDSVVRFPYENGALTTGGAPETVVAELPGGGRLRGGGHWTRDVAFSLDGKRMFVSVGSHSNVDDPDESKDEFHRAAVLAFTPQGGAATVYASGIRNAVGIAIHPRSGALWVSVNERDGLGDNLVPDYITSVKEGGFYGWPWFYIGGNQDPRHAGKHPELRAKALVPDVLLQPHNASLQLTFYDGRQFPADYQGDIFAAQHGSWNRGVRTGYEVIRVPMHGKDTAAGEYEDFLTGFVTAKGEVWGRPVGVAVAADGALLVTDDGSNAIWRVSAVAKPSSPVSK
jgi:glucose/arabinose dehydrogenase